jgi:hypothetical protein
VQLTIETSQGKGDEIGCSRVLNKNAVEDSISLVRSVEFIVDDRSYAGPQPNQALPSGMRIVWRNFDCKGLKNKGQFSGTRDSLNACLGTVYPAKSTEPSLTGPVAPPEAYDMVAAFPVSLADDTEPATQRSELQWSKYEVMGRYRFKLPSGVDHNIE